MKRCIMTVGMVSSGTVGSKRRIPPWVASMDVTNWTSFQSRM